MQVAVCFCKSHIQAMNTPTVDRELNVVFGAGQVGERLAHALIAKGKRVRLVRLRSFAQPNVRHLERLSGDARDVDFAVRVCRDARVVYDCVNPPYDKWGTELLPLGQSIVQAATKADAKLVALDNLYMYGRPEGPLSETSRRAPCSKKGALRLLLENLRMNAGAQVTIARASDFIGENLPNSFWSPRFFQRIYANKTGETLGNPNMAHAYTDIAEVVRGLAILGESSQANGRIWHLPTAEAQTTQSIATQFGALLGIRATVAPMAPWLLRSLGVFVPTLREMIEMQYQYEVPFLIDDTAFTSTFGVKATPLKETIARTAAWAKVTFAPARVADTKA
jgi:nucleoside-diphosphate-sugar epimerase